MYSDAKAKAATLGEFNFFNAWMSQPKSQLGTFRAWAGKDSDIRYEMTYSFEFHTDQNIQLLSLLSPHRYLLLDTTRYRSAYPCRRQCSDRNRH